jgi:hypothetical protein
MTNNNSTGRDAFISGLRAVAAYLQATPYAPIPGYSPLYVFPQKGDWAEKCAEIEAIASLLGVTAHLVHGGHYVANRHFGPVEYRAVAIPPKAEDEGSE